MNALFKSIRIHKLRNTKEKNVKSPWSREIDEDQNWCCDILVRYSGKTTQLWNS